MHVFHLSKRPSEKIQFIQTINRRRDVKHISDTTDRRCRYFKKNDNGIITLDLSNTGFESMSISVSIPIYNEPFPGVKKKQEKRLYRQQ